MKYTPQPPKPQVLQEYLVTNTISLAYRYFDTCPQARTLSAYSLAHNAYVLFDLPCQTWSCRYCAENKIKKLAAITMLAAPNRLLTLTINPSLFLSPKEAWEKTRKQVPVLIRRLRKKFGEVEYLRVTEVTQRGWPHYHLLVRSGYLPHSVVKSYWNEQTGAWIVDLRQVKKTFSAYKYLVKYLSKLHDLQWTERHVSMSRGFAPKTDKHHDDQLQLAETDFHQQHPAYHVAEFYKGCQLRRLSKRAHLVVNSSDLNRSSNHSAADPPADVAPGNPNTPLLPAYSPPHANADFDDPPPPP